MLREHVLIDAGVPESPAVLGLDATIGASTRQALGDLRAQVEAFERQCIIQALEACGGNQTRTAEDGISRRALILRLDAYAVPRPRVRSRRSNA